MPYVCRAFAVQCLYDFYGKQWRSPSGIAAGRYRYGSPYGTIAPAHMEVMTAFTNNVSASYNYIYRLLRLLSCSSTPGLMEVTASQMSSPVRRTPYTVLLCHLVLQKVGALERRTGSHIVSTCWWHVAVDHMWPPHACTRAAHNPTPCTPRDTPP